jgi:hypothetical protein
VRRPLFLVSLPVQIRLNLGNHTRTRNGENAYEKGHKKPGLNLREALPGLQNLYASVRFPTAASN